MNTEFNIKEREELIAKVLPAIKKGGCSTATAKTVESVAANIFNDKYYKGAGHIVLTNTIHLSLNNLCERGFAKEKRFFKKEDYGYLASYFSTKEPYKKISEHNKKKMILPLYQMAEFIFSYNYSLKLKNKKINCYESRLQSGIDVVIQLGAFIEHAYDNILYDWNKNTSPIPLMCNHIIAPSPELIAGYLMLIKGHISDYSAARLNAYDKRQREQRSNDKNAYHHYLLRIAPIFKEAISRSDIKSSNSTKLKQIKKTATG